MSPQSGVVVAVRDEGTVWLVSYRRDTDQSLDTVAFDWRNFAQMYEAESGRSFFTDYRFGAGRDAVAQYFSGRRIHVASDASEQAVWIE